MKVIAILAFLHGAIHLLGFGKAFGLLSATPLRTAISRPRGVLWLVASILLFVCGGLSFRLSYQPPWEPSGVLWLSATAGAILISQILIVTAWRDAKLGTVANILIAMPVILELLELRSSSFRSTYSREIATASATPVNNGAADAAKSIVTESDISSLPPALQRYLRRTGALGQPRAREIHVHWRGEMKRTPTSGWMSIEADQYERFDAPPARYFFLYASQYGLPFQSLHRYVSDSATMNVRVLSLFDVVDARGDKMTQSETVTLFNDMCVLAPSSLIDATLVRRSVTWTVPANEDRRLHASFTNAGHTVDADLVFDAEGDLIDFISQNSRFLSPDGKIYEQYPWSTPLHDYKDFGGGYRVASRGDAIWRRPTGDFTYGRFVIAAITVNDGRAKSRPARSVDDRMSSLSSLSSLRGDSVSR